MRFNFSNFKPVTSEEFNNVINMCDYERTAFSNGIAYKYRNCEDHNDFAFQDNHGNYYLDPEAL